MEGLTWRKGKSRSTKGRRSSPTATVEIVMIKINVDAHACVSSDFTHILLVSPLVVHPHCQRKWVWPQPPYLAWGTHEPVVTFHCVRDYMCTVHCTHTVE